VAEPATLYLKPSGVKALDRGHPWIFSKAVAKAAGRPLAGQTVRLADKAGAFKGWAWYSPQSGLRARLIDRRPEALDPTRPESEDEWLAGRLEAALTRRRALLQDPATNAFRLINAESDGLPGLVVDAYADCLVLQANSSGAERVKDRAAQWLAGRLEPACVFERSDADLRRREGLRPSSGPLIGPAPEGPVRINQDGAVFLVDVSGGQKTGFYLDQRQNRTLVAARAEGLEVLDCFCYTGGFSVQALRQGARRVVLVDSSARALALARTHLQLNGLAERADLVQANVHEVLRTYRDSRQSFDLIILDPPKLAPTKGQAAKAARAYKDLNLFALKLLRPGGLLATFSCSAAIDPPYFQEILLWAALDAGLQLQIVARLSQPEDHPILVGFPESEYLKGLLCQPV